MSGSSGESPLWTRVLAISESMDDPAVSIGQIRGLLYGLEEGFATVFDPAEEFPEFVALRLCKSLERMLARLDTREQA